MVVWSRAYTPVLLERRTCAGMEDKVRLGEIKKGLNEKLTILIMPSKDIKKQNTKSNPRLK
jgi:hypothetical protein